jgi:hypothetical protein
MGHVEAGFGALGVVDWAPLAMALEIDGSFLVTKLPQIAVEISLLWDRKVEMRRELTHESLYKIGTLVDGRWTENG